MSPACFAYFSRSNCVRRSLDVVPNLVSANGSPIKAQGVFDVKFFFNNRLCHGLFVVSDHVNNNIVGMNIIRQYRMTLDPVSHQVSSDTTIELGVSTLDNGDSNSPPQGWDVQVAHTTSVDPGSAARVRCRLLHPTTRKPITAARQFIADIDGLAFSFSSNDSGSFSPHLPNADVVAKIFTRGDVIGTANAISDFEFPSDDNVVAGVQAGTPKPRPHTRLSLIHISEPTRPY